MGHFTAWFSPKPPHMSRTDRYIDCNGQYQQIAQQKILSSKRVTAIGKNKSIGPDGIFGEILKLGGEAMILYLA
jgi:hypothetical protein